MAWHVQITVSCGMIKRPVLSKFNKQILSVLSLSLLLAGCGATVQKETKQRRYFWPPLPDTPRVEFISAYMTNQDFPKTKWESLKDSLVGVTDVRGMAKPHAIMSDGEGRIFVSDADMGEVVIFDLVNYTVNTLGKGELEGVFSVPVGLALDGDGNIYVSDSKKNKVLVFTKDEKPLRSIGNNETIDWPAGITVDNNLKRLYVVNSHKHNVAVFDLEGNLLFNIAGRGNADGRLNFPTDVDLDSQGNVVVADSMNARVQVFSPDGKFIRKFGNRGDSITDFQVIKGLAVDKATDNVYVMDGRAHRLLIFSKEGEALLAVGGGAAVAGKKQLTPGGFLIPQGIFIDKKGRIYIADSMNRRIQIFQIVTDDWLKENPL